MPSTSALTAESAYESRALGGMLGLLIGDALGVPYEFHEPETIPPLDALSFEPPPGFRRAHAGVPPGTWSDDGAQALCLLASLLDCGQLDLDDFGQRLVRWYDEGYFAVDGKVFDVGITTSAAIRRLKTGVPADEAGSTHPQSNGNGALMRVLPLAVWHTGTDAELIHDSRQQSLVTHGHLRSQLCCALYCLWARRILEDHAFPYDAAVRTLREHLDDDPAARFELDTEIMPDDPAIGEGSGYVVDALHSARFAAEAPDFAETIRRAIRLGHDTDTTACIAGGIVGLRLGLAGIPKDWQQHLRGQDLLIPILEQFLQHNRHSRIGRVPDSSRS
ncbi:ADP-ribosylglycohydrolase family protein [Ahniella affigens]|uniref:ADP-ribosylglycohydrolase family protein n=1 Tax=Ahniella affigens TaxID=2021234 RepID=UPI001981C737|nr:ADP-ribosylglycohydrolase family protein [Ahniella affigens]